MDYRHEIKFLVSDMDLEIIRYRLLPIMKQDIHQRGESYTIRSLYFDDLQNSCMKENEDGVDNRQKFRIRIYNGELSFIKLEKKIKYRGMTRKESTLISKSDALTYMDRSVKVFQKESARLEKELQTRIQTKGMHAASIVEYERTAFVEARGNVRITFDRNISGSTKVNDFFESRLMAIPLLPKGIQVLEVKYDELLPGYIYEVLNMGMLQRSSFSKYCYSRAMEALN
ncbi:MAG: polyphosphate polymerase domain-containing protein [Lachnospiraceae bacterium]|nr:polyphosphate polymerase domain-containing protein [Lachnospiraceae bacterium]